MTAAEDLVGVSVGLAGKMHFIRFHLADRHLDRIKGSRALIRGQPKNGFLIEPDSKGLKIVTGNLKNGGYLQTTLTPFEISKMSRRRVDVRPRYERGGIFVPALSSAWIDGSAEFVPGATPPEADSFKLHASPGNGVSRLAGPEMNGSPTAPLPKPQVEYAVPTDTTIAQMQVELGAKLNDARELIKAMEARTGMKFVLDRHLRLVVAL